jgi:RNA polymerase subunit RPABC4/transcription elongation factor Spt4
MLQDIHVQSACPACKQHAEPDYVFCPWCQTRLKRMCTRCDRPLLLRWRNCPYCGQPALQTPAALGPRAGNGGADLAETGARTREIRA